MKDLAPDITRVRLIVEGIPAREIKSDDIERYLRELSEVVEMVQLCEPVTHRSPKYGWGGWIHWEDSGAHFYFWHTPRHFFSVDVYTCKHFDTGAVVQFTREFFGASEIAHQEV